MLANDGLLRIFWPNTPLRATTPGVIVGWRNSELDLFVITVLEDVEAHNVEHALRMGTLYRNSPHPIVRIFQLCAKSNMFVLGTLNQQDTPVAFSPSHICAYTSTGTNVPQIYCPVQTGLSVQVIMFDPPNSIKMQYMSLSPISLALGDKHMHAENTSTLFDRVNEEEDEEKARLGRLVEKLKLHTVVRHYPSRKEMALSTILNQVNCSLEMAELLQKNSPLIGPRRRRSMSVSERVVESAQSLYTFAALFLWNIFATYVYPVASRAFLIALIIHRIIAEGILQVLEWRPPSPHITFATHDLPHGRGLALKDLSASCQQIHIRLQQFSYYPIQYLLLRRRHRTWSSIPHSNSDYIRFYNSLWLVANDVIIGIALGSYIIENAQTASTLLGNILNQYTIDGLKRMIRWLMSYPAGLKLNNELAAFLGDLFLWVIEYWSATTTLLVMPYLPTIVYFIGFSSFAGASMPIAIFSDLVSLLTIHIYSFYMASARIFNWQLTIIFSLFQLFRGKKRNVLRNRIDSCDYDLDQLLLGTILFTLLFFLLPTVIVFYLTFASARMTIISLKAVLDTFLACLNHFPLFAIMLRIKDGKRLPGGVHFSIQPPPDPVCETFPTSEVLAIRRLSAAASTAVASVTQHTPSPRSSTSSAASESITGPTSNISYVRLSSTPLPLRDIFAQYFHLASRIRKHYLSPRVALCLVTGRFVPPLGRGEMYGLQYSMLPRRRVPVGEVWGGLVEDEDFRKSATKVKGGLWPSKEARLWGNGVYHGGKGG